MGNQHALVLLVLLALCAVQQTFTSSLHAGDLTVEKYNLLSDVDKVEALKWAHPKEHGIKISTPKVKEIPITSTTTATETTKQAKKLAATTQHQQLGDELNNALYQDNESAERQQMSDETLNDLIEASKHSVALADDPRFNKMLPNKLKTENTTVTSNKSEENYYDYDTDDYDDDYNYDDEVAATESAQKAKSSSSTIVKPNRAVNAAAKNSKKVEMKPIKEEKTSSSKPKANTEIVDNKQQQSAKKIEDLDEDEYDDEDDINDVLIEIVYNQNVLCSRYSF